MVNILDLQQKKHNSILAKNSIYYFLNVKGKFLGIVLDTKSYRTPKARIDTKLKKPLKVFY